VQSVDTNVLARFYCDDPHDPEAKRQRPIARRIMVESASLYVPLSVVLELEWVMRGFYEIEASEVSDVMDHLLGMPHVTVERWEAVKDAVEMHRAGLDFADALHWASSKGCDALISFDKKFVRAAERAGAEPAVLAAS
jgi:predicted nucleic-acid-binding protein